MAGYYYNDGRVRKVDRLVDIAPALARGPALVVSDGRGREVLERLPRVRATLLARGPRDHALIELRWEPN
jgi:hypothetical protein